MHHPTLQRVVIHRRDYGYGTKVAICSYPWETVVDTYTFKAILHKWSPVLDNAKHVRVYSDQILAVMPLIDRGMCIWPNVEKITITRGELQNEVSCALLVRNLKKLAMAHQRLTDIVIKPPMSSVYPNAGVMNYLKQPMIAFIYNRVRVHYVSFGRFLPFDTE